MGLIRLTMPTIKAELNATEPKASPTAMDPCRLSAALTPKASSGRVVPKAIKMTPKEKRPKEILSAILTPDHTRAEELKSRSTAAAKNQARSLAVSPTDSRPCWL